MALLWTIEKKPLVSAGKAGNADLADKTDIIDMPGMANVTDMARSKLTQICYNLWTTLSQH